ncbi:MAG: hypothetical protein OXN17_18840 [Candidatus Poribacteria bacterium]|nr:hypothetical protein [Candidatus Poribacteria bacterium]MDE0504010.1 hypothetical protein [Candidatus Poribacteria bacterium]
MVLPYKRTAAAVTGIGASIFASPRQLAVLTPLVGRMAFIEFIAFCISGAMIGVTLVYLQPLLDSWTIVQEYIAASILAIVGWLIVRKSNKNTSKHRLFYRPVGAVPLTVGIAIFVMPLL